MDQKIIIVYRKEKKRFKKREIIYKDLVDDYEPSSPTEDKEGIDDETGEEDNDEIYETLKNKKQQPKNSKTKIIVIQLYSYATTINI